MIYESPTSSWKGTGLHRHPWSRTSHTSSTTAQYSSSKRISSTNATSRIQRNRDLQHTIGKHETKAPVLSSKIISRSLWRSNLQDLWRYPEMPQSKGRHSIGRMRHGCRETRARYIVTICFFREVPKNNTKRRQCPQNRDISKNSCRDCTRSCKNS